MSALRYTIFALTLLFGLQGAFAMSAKRPEVAPSLKINREVPVQLYRGKIIEVEFDHNGAVECYRHGDFSEIYYISTRLILLAESRGISIRDDNGEFAIGLSGVKLVPRGESFAKYSGKSYRGFFKVVYEKMLDVPTQLYGSGLGSSYQQQSLTLSKHFKV